MRRLASLLISFTLGCASEAATTTDSRASAGAAGSAAATGGGAGGSAGQGGGASLGGSGALAAGGAPMGGQPAAGSAGATPGAAGLGGTGGTMLESPPGFFVNGYLTSGPWLGWVFTFADSSGLGTIVSPQCADTCTPAWGAQACVNGTVAQDPTSGTFIGLAFHVNDPMAGEVGTWKVTGEGIFVSVSNPPASARLQLQELDTTSNDQRYCANLPATGTGLIPFSNLKTYCWGDPEHPSKELQVDTLIHEAAIIVPGSSAGPTAFDFCLVDIGPR